MNGRAAMWMGLGMAVCLVGCSPTPPHVDPALPPREQAVLYVEWLRNPDPHVTFQGQQFLRDLGEDAVPALTDALSDDKPWVRRAAAQVLQDIREDQTSPPRTNRDTVRPNNTR